MQFQFNARQHDPYSGGYEVVPGGTYPVMIVKSNIKATSDNSGGYLQLDFQIQDGPFKGKTIFDRLNLFNNNQTAVNIANQRLSAICHAAGVYDINATDAPDNSVPMLHNIPMGIRVSVKSSAIDKNDPSKGNRENNNVEEYLDRAGQKVAKGGGAPQQQPGPQFAAPAAGQQPQFGAQPGGAPGGFQPPQQPQQQPGGFAPPQQGGFAPPQQGGFAPPAQPQPGPAPGPAPGPGWQTGAQPAPQPAQGAPQPQPGGWPGQAPQQQPSTMPGQQPGGTAPGWQGGAGAGMPWAR